LTVALQGTDKAIVAIVAALTLVGGAAGAWAVRFGGLLIEPVRVDVLGSCDGATPCARVSCTLENQGPVRSSGRVAVDVFEGAFEDGTTRRFADLDLRARERTTVVLDYPGVAPTDGLMVRCMPWYSAGRAADSTVLQ
jgi:hypothetical protein